MKLICQNFCDSKRYFLFCVIRFNSIMLDIYCSFATEPGKDSAGCFPSITKGSLDVGFRTPRTKKVVPISRSPSSDSSSVTTAKSEISLKIRTKKSTKPAFRPSDDRKSSDWNVEIAVSNSPLSKVASSDHFRAHDLKRSDIGELDNSANSKMETKSSFNKVHDYKQSNISGLRSGFKVVPYHDEDDSESVVSNATEEVYDYPKDPEDLSLIREQLLQIENQQSNLLDLLQVCYWSLISLFLDNELKNQNITVKAVGLLVHCLYSFILLIIVGVCELSIILGYL